MKLQFGLVNLTTKAGERWINLFTFQTFTRTGVEVHMEADSGDNRAYQFYFQMSEPKL